MAANVDYLIIGGGVAGVTAAAKIRENKPDASIEIISHEPVCFYSRVLLTNFLEGKVGRENLILRDDKWFCENKIKVSPGEDALGLDFAAHKITTSADREIIFKKLLIATGVTPRPLTIEGGNLPGVYNLWTLADAQRIAAEIELIKKLPTKNQDVAVIGGGFICQSLVKIFVAHNFRTHLLMRGEYYWSKFIGPAAGNLIDKKFLENNIKTYKKTRAQEIIREKDGALVIVTDGGEKIRVAMALIGVGTGPNIGWLEGSGLVLEDGIKVNEYLETNAPDVYAAGDVANFFDSIYGDFHRKGNWVNASRQGEIAARNMLGDRAVFNELTSFTVDIFGLNFIFMGEYNRAMADQVVISDKGKTIREFYFKGNRLIGAALLNASGDRALIERAIKDKIEINKNEQLRLSEAEHPLKEEQLYGIK